MAGVKGKWKIENGKWKFLVGTDKFYKISVLFKKIVLFPVVSIQFILVKTRFFNKNHII